MKCTTCNGSGLRDSYTVCTTCSGLGDDGLISTVIEVKAEPKKRKSIIKRILGK